MRKKKDWLKALRGMGFAAFLFFLIKGLLWLGVLFGLVRIGGC